jgi:hypothetical protein
MGLGTEMDGTTKTIVAMGVFVLMIVAFATI